MKFIDSFFGGDALLAGINEGLFAFLPKWEKEDDREFSKDGMYRSALDLRLSTLQNADIDIAAGCINWVIKPVVGSAVCHCKMVLLEVASMSSMRWI